MNELEVKALCCCCSEFSYCFVVSVAGAFAIGACCIIKEGLRIRVDYSEFTVTAAGGIGIFLSARVVV
jgi:hypothetical protein